MKIHRALLALALWPVASVTGQPDAGVAVPNTAIGYPVFRGSPAPVPESGVAFAPRGHLERVFARDLADGAGRAPGHDFWMDRMLAREGDGGGFGDSNNWLFTRGRAAYLYTHDPTQPGFVGDVAYWHKTGHDALLRLQLEENGKTLQLQEAMSRRRQTPSYFTTVFEDTVAGIQLRLVKYITHQNIAVAEMKVSSLDGQARTLTLKAISPLVSHPEGGELTGVFQTHNDITTVFARLSGDGFAVDGTEISRTLQIPATGASASVKVQLGLTTRELPASRAEYDRIATQMPQDAYRHHVTEYNRWWADHLPWLDTPEDNIDKTLFYRWWLLRFNFLDAEVPGNDYQFPIAIEGVLGYNNAIVLTTCMFLDDLKYLRDPVYAYGTLIGAGEVAANGKYVDNPGSPANWSNSYTQYITAAAWRAFQIHGGPAALAGKLADYGRADVLGLLDAYDHNGNGLIEYDWSPMTGNDADAVSFDWAKAHGEPRMDRTESAWVWANAKAAAEAARVSGDMHSAQQMEGIAARIRASVLSVLWVDETGQQDSVGLSGNLLKHRQADGPELPVDWKEVNNYYPFAAGLMPKPGDADFDLKYVNALRLFADAGQYPVFPFYTANQADKRARGEGEGSNNFSVINSTVIFRLLGSVLREYPNPYLNTEWYRKLLYWNAWSHYIDGDNRYPDQNEFWAEGSADEGGRIGYRSWIHHTQLGTTNFTVIEDVIGLRPRSDGKIELFPIDIGWEYFAADNLRYRRRDLTIIWDREGDHYGGDVPKGYSLWLDGRRVLTLDRLARVLYDPETGTAKILDDAVNSGPPPQILQVERAALARPEQVRITPDTRVAEVLSKAGIDVALPPTAVNMARGAKVSASFSTPGFAPGAAVDGSTANEPFWGTVGSPEVSDWLALDFGEVRTLDDVRVYFYRSSSPQGQQHGLPSGTRAGYAPPWLYTLQYREGTEWKDVPGQVRDQVIAEGNRNRIRFPALNTQHLRIKLLHAGDLRSGLKEIQVYATGAPSVQVSANQPPQVEAWQEDRIGAGNAVHLAGRIGDDALPSARLSAHWHVLSAPAGGSAIFENPANPRTVVRLTAPGEYLLRLTASDGELESHAEVRINAPVQATGGGIPIAGDATASAQLTAGHHRVSALNDGHLPTSGGTLTADRRWGSWGRQQPETVWIQYEWPHPVRIGSSAVYFWDDQPGGGVAQPAAWSLQYRADGRWREIKADYPLASRKGEPSHAHFAPVTTTALRALMTTALAADGTRRALGVDEWQVFADPPERLEPVDVRTAVGQMPQFPQQIAAWYADGSRAEVTVRWPEIEAGRLAGDGRIDVHGLADGGIAALATVWVRASEPGQINTVDALPEVHTTPGMPPVLPMFATVQYNDGSRERRPIMWSAPPHQGDVMPGSRLTLRGEVGGRGNSGRLSVQVTVVVTEPEG